MKHLFLVAAAVASVPLSGAALAGSVRMPDDDIVVTAPTLENWSDRVFKDVARNLRYPELMPGWPAHTGVVAVKFNCSDDGSPADVAVQKSSGHRDLDQATVRAVRRVGTLHPLPQDISGEQQFIVKVLFSNSPDAERKAAEMRAEAARHNARVLADRTNVAALEIAPRGS